MAKEICPLCGEEIVGGVCADCGGSLNREMNESPITETLRQNTEGYTYQKNSSVSRYTNITGTTAEHNSGRNAPVYNTDKNTAGRDVVFVLLSVLMMSSLIGVVVSVAAAFITRKRLYTILAVLNVVTFLLRILFSFGSIF